MYVDCVFVCSNDVFRQQWGLLVDRLSGVQSSFKCGSKPQAPLQTQTGLFTRFRLFCFLFCVICATRTVDGPPTGSAVVAAETSWSLAGPSQPRSPGEYR